MSKNQGYFSIVQYSEHPERLEFVNIGVVIFHSEISHVSFKLSEDAKRINSAYGINMGAHYKYLKNWIESKLVNDFSASMPDIEKLNAFMSMRAGKVRMSPARSMFVQNVSKDIDELFASFVEPLKRNPKRRRAANLKLRKLLKFEKVEDLLDNPEPVNLKNFSIKPDYGYQNGRYNLIKSVSLHGEPDSALDKVSNYAVRGKILFDHNPLINPKKLVVVGDDEDQDEDVVEEINNILSSHDVLFYPMSKVSPLVNDIKQNLVNH